MPKKRSPTFLKAFEGAVGQSLRDNDRKLLGATHADVRAGINAAQDFNAGGPDPRGTKAREKRAKTHSNRRNK